jgi:hypothetical protein
VVHRPVDYAEKSDVPTLYNGQENPLLFAYHCKLIKMQFE